MIVIGAGGHAAEVLEILIRAGGERDLFVFDDVSAECPDRLFGRFEVLRSSDAAAAHFELDPRFVLGLGGPAHRRSMADRFRALGGVLTSVASDQAEVGCFETDIGDGVNLMDGVRVSSRVVIGEGVLLNRGSNVHHDTTVSAYSEVGPGAQLLGRVTVGRRAAVGAGAIILPDRRIGDRAVVGAGAVVTGDVPSGEVWAGVPARRVGEVR
jgi:sugar O-acyltransferase (sialic acid O-acetyltransferase NeuD family)